MKLSGGLLCLLSAGLSSGAARADESEPNKIKKPAFLLVLPQNEVVTPKVVQPGEEVSRSPESIAIPETKVETPRIVEPESTPRRHDPCPTCGMG